MGKPSAPTPPDPKQTAGAQTATNIGTAIANTQLGNVNQVGPDGSLTYKQSGAHKYTDPNTGAVHNIPKYTATTELSPTNKKIYDQNLSTKKILSGAGEKQAHRLAGHLGRGLDTKNLPTRVRNAADTPELRSSYGGDYAKNRARVENAIMDRMQPRVDRDREALRTRLENQGITEGSDAWSASMDDFQSGVNDARLGAVLAGGQEQSRLDDLAARRAGFENQTAGQKYGMDRARVSDQNSIRGDVLNERTALRNQPINEITALLSGGQVTQPNFRANQPAQIPTVDYAGLVNQNYNQKLANYSQQNANNQSILGGLFGLGSAGIMGGLFG